jgi:peptide/nickel transport system ATP-binding protein
MNTPILSLRKLTTAFRTEDGWKEVIRDISFDVQPGETVAIVGESGSGKSVTSLSIMGLLDKKARVSGQVLLEGRDLLPLSEAEMRRVRGNDIAMIFQEPMTSLNPVFPVGDQIAELLLRHNKVAPGQVGAEVLRLMDRVRIPNAAKRVGEYPHQFSGGMRQRVMIAMALAARPRLLIADEPTTALDVTIQGQILDLIKEIQDEQGMAVLFITHDMGVVAEIADRTVVMYRGDHVETGKTTDLFTGARHPYTRALLAAVPRLGEMRGQDWPLRFPAVDMASGDITPQPAVVDTINRRDTPVLSVKNLVTRFASGSDILGRPTGKVHAVENVSFDLWQGETLSLVGESGCGKSTLGRVILGLDPLQGGRIRLDGQDVTASRRMPPALRARMQVVFQDPFGSFDPRWRVDRLLAEPFHLTGLPPDWRDRVAAALVEVGLQPGAARRFIHEFSGGQRQRLAIARALIIRPALIVLDEAVSALDVRVRAQVLDLLARLQADHGLSYLFISHDLSVVRGVTDRILVMQAGRIVEEGPPGQIIDTPRHEYTRSLVAAMPEIPAEWV